jgi:hypothetical protein
LFLLKGCRVARGAMKSIRCFTQFGLAIMKSSESQVLASRATIFPE